MGDDELSPENAAPAEAPEAAREAAPAPLGSPDGGATEQQAAEVLKTAIKAHLPVALHSCLRGRTIAEVEQALVDGQALYAQVRQAVTAELAALVPAAHATAGAPPVPANPFDLIRAGLSAVLRT
ncbi:MAG TPA: hypothetical protein VKY74_15145 [Chloroflexia bacterium]|nr:hypothetical protein [Chloroflexia bacterium]